VKAVVLHPIPEIRCCTCVCTVLKLETRSVLFRRESLKLPPLLCSKSFPLSSFRYLCCAYSKSFCPPKQAAKLIGLVKHVCQCHSRFILCVHDSNAFVAKIAKGVNICGEVNENCSDIFNLLANFLLLKNYLAI